jgi:hypothetical protein
MAHVKGMLAKVMPIERQRIAVLHREVCSALESAMEARAPWDVCAQLLSSGRVLDGFRLADPRRSWDSEPLVSQHVADAERALGDWRSWRDAAH